MKAVLISIQPKWVEKIANGEKTIEVRKTRPKIETPFKCYIYCTKEYGYSNGEKLEMSHYLENGIWFDTGKVIGEFVCDKVDDLRYVPTKYYLQPAGTWEEMICNSSCLSVDQIKEYAKGGTIYGWHISDLKIYDKPKKLSDFLRPCNKDAHCFYCKKALFVGGNCEGRIEVPPQSWCYVEEKQDER